MTKYIIPSVIIAAFLLGGCTTDSSISMGDGSASSSSGKKPDKKTEHEEKDEELDEFGNPVKESCKNADLKTSIYHCGACNNACGANEICKSGKCECDSGFELCGDKCAPDGKCDCTPGETQECYDGPEGTENIGECHGGVILCAFDPEIGSYWDGKCVDQVVPDYEYHCDPSKPEKDADCNGVADSAQDEDNDGFAVCGNKSDQLLDCCDNTNMCNTSKPDYVNPGKTVDCKGNNIDDDCDGHIDEDEVDCSSGTVSPESCAIPREFCSETTDYIQSHNSVSADTAYALAKAMDLCTGKVSSETKQHGIIEATLYSMHTSGSGGFGGSSGCANPNDVFDLVSGQQVNIKESMKSSSGEALIKARGGKTFVMLSSGMANDAFSHRDTADIAISKTGKIPEPYCSKHGQRLESHKDCGGSNKLNDSVHLHLKLKAPEYAQGFSFDFRFFTREYPYYICTTFNDFFLTLLTDENGKPFVDTNDNGQVNDEDGNISYDKAGNPVSVNNAFFTTCASPKCFDRQSMSSIKNSTGCPAIIEKCVDNKCGSCDDGPADLSAYFSRPYQGSGNGTILRGGGTAWLTTKAPVSPGQIFNLDFYIWDTDDQKYDSTVLLDNFQWLCSKPGVGTDFAPPIDGIN